LGDSGRTEKPTPRRLQKAREDGRFPTSREFVSAVQFVTFIALLGAYGEECIASLENIMRTMLAGAFRGELTAARLEGELHAAVMANLRAFGVVAFALVAVTLAAQLAVTQGGIALKHLMPDFNRLNPLGKLRSLPRQNIPAFVQGLVLLPVFAITVWLIVSPHWNEFLLLPLATVEAGAAHVGEAVSSLVWKAAFVFLLLGSIDLFRQRRTYIADLRMSMQDIRDEHKELEGNPQIKMRIRRLQRDLLRRNMMKQIPNATAVVTNPTHYAVALRYEVESAGAPTVLAKGKNYLALRIKQRAIDHNIPIVENPPLAQALYKSVGVGQEIPPNLYTAVAEILAYIFRLSAPRGRR
jgi:flagellar biosynthetic protein FlhB